MSEDLLPFMDGPWKLSMGLRRLELADWLCIDRHHAAQMRQRAALVTERRAEVIGCLPGSEAGCQEILDLLTAFLPARYPERWRMDGRFMVDRVEDRQIGLDSDLPLVTAGLLVQEDLCLMRKGTDGYVLAAAMLCFPSHWRLADKLGLPMAGIHQPVPGFADRLGPTADRFMATLDPDRPVWRANWTVAETDELFLPGHRAQRTFATDRTIGAQLFLRIERQTLRRLPRSGDVLFTIHTSVRPLQDAIVLPVHAQALASRIREMSDGMSRYKGFHQMGLPLLDWLDQMAVQPG
ncbi:MAG TPA: DUF3445 domain-containing protein [Geminicoccus sp.]|jgi:hypothetical protein|uniref:heme-dependent oxidative N-demethylase family protein n=1 Tax=Geminicoccus sp. TaxID=2024832 RepID=UPI002E380EC0|nr:DUF3445 domain-containing protein [Geminicoccus sp.]HEX2528243.1 DUF3445 domain-containing protein [Geminicoccus sp.]